jgi:two-component system, NarL family, nitrate/nitrite response regulator NarL
VSTNSLVIGLGYVVLPLAREAANAGPKVMGFDLNETTVTRLCTGFRATKLETEIDAPETVIIRVPTPLSVDGIPDLAAVSAACELAGRILRPGMLVALESTSSGSALVETHIRLLLGLAEVYERCGARDEAAEQLREVLRQDPTREAVHRQLMRLYAGMGAADQAVRQFHVCEQALRRELNLAPRPETVSLYDAIHAERFPRRPPAIDQDRDDAPGLARARTARSRAGEHIGRKIVICDPQRMLAEALASALDARGYQVLAVTTTVSEVVIAVGAGRPDVCLLGLPPFDPLSGVDAVRAIRERYPSTKVLVLSEVTHPKTLSQLRRSGVEGLTHQDQSVDQIASALDAVVDGRNVLDPGPPRHPDRGTERLCELSPREKEILARIVSGQNTRQMSHAMNVTVGTVRTYVKNVLAKLGVHSRLQLAALASRDGSLIDQAPAVDSLPFADDPTSRSRRRSLLEERTRGKGRGW